jgi:hypothetical protein
VRPLTVTTGASMLIVPWEVKLSPPGAVILITWLLPPAPAFVVISITDLTESATAGSIPGNTVSNRIRLLPACSINESLKSSDCHTMLLGSLLSGASLFGLGPEK